MDRLIANNTVPLASAATAPTSGTPQYATDGNPAAGVPPTQWPSYQYNAIQEELMNAIESDGTAGDRTNNAQLKAKLVGRLLNVQKFTASGTYTPTPGTKRILVEVQGAGGASGGAPATGAGQCSLGAPGSGGAYASGQFFSGFAGAAVTVGAGGIIGAAGTGGGNGGTSGFSPVTGTAIVAPGGGGGGITAAASPPIFAGAGPTANASGGTLINIAGEAGGVSLGMGSGTAGATGGVGGNSRFGIGGVAALAPGVGQASGHGSGGGGSSNVQSSSAIVGANGTDGIVIIWEFS